MTKQFTLILGVMMIVFSLTLSGGGLLSIFYLAPGENDKYIHAALFFGGAAILLVGLAGCLAGLVSMIGSAILKAAETTEAEEGLLDSPNNLDTYPPGQ